MLESVLAVTAVAALVAVMMVLFGKPPPLRAQRAAGGTTGATPGTASPAVPPSPVPVLILNNTRVTGLAARAAATFRARGWPVRRTGNYRGGRVPVTTVYYAAGEEGIARLFATRFPAVRRVLPRPAGLPGSGLTVVLTLDFRP